VEWSSRKQRVFERSTAVSEPSLLAAAALLYPPHRGPSKKTAHAFASPCDLVMPQPGNKRETEKKRQAGKASRRQADVGHVLPFSSKRAVP